MIDDNHCQAKIFQLLLEGKSASISPQGEVQLLQHGDLWNVVKRLARCRAFRLDSREVQHGDVFMAVAGQNVCGSDFVPKIAETAGFLLFSDHDWHHRSLKKWFFGLPPEKKKSIAEKSIVVANKKVEDLACALPAPFYRYPSQRLYVTGVTGTNGKTSLCYLLERLYEKIFPVGVIGTVGARFSGPQKVKRFSLHNTTPNAAVMQHLLAMMADAGVKIVFLEISSHALALGRTQGLRFDSLLWSNFTPEHLDFHPTMQDYFDAKSSVFSLLKDKKSAFAVVGTKGLVGFDFGQKVHNLQAPIFALSSSFATQKEKNSLQSWPFSEYFSYESLRDEAFCRHIRFSLALHPRGITQENKQQKKCLLTADFLGAGATENLSLALLHRYFYKMVRKSGVAKVDWDFFDETALQKDLNQIKKLSIPGRMHRVDDYPVYIDYAHTPDALAMALETMRAKNQKLVVIFGCGGERDKKKRGEMGVNAWKGADVVIVTSDNPRHENPLNIIADILSKMSTGHREWKKKQLVVIPDRQQAIAFGVSFLHRENGDSYSLLLAGKGHEKHQIIRSERKTFDEKKMVRDSFFHFLSNRFFLSEIIQVFGASQLLFAGKSWDGLLFCANALPFVKKHWQEKIYHWVFSMFEGIFTDTRADKKGEIFFAFDGEKYSAIDFVDEAFRFGAKIFVVDERHFAKMRAWSKKNTESVVILVKNVFEVYGRLARYKMQKLSRRTDVPHCRIGVTGSAGKSEMKEILGHTLASQYKVFVSKKNYNNHIGVPHNIFSIKSFYDVYIFEMGMNHQGEIATLAQMIRPHVVVLTNVFAAHAQNFHSIREIAQAKSEFFPFGDFDCLLGKSTKNNEPRPAQVFFSRHIHFRPFFCQLAQKYGWETTLVDWDFFVAPTLKFKRNALWTEISLAFGRQSFQIKGVHPYAHQFFSLARQVALFLGLKSEKVVKVLAELPENMMPRRFEVVQKKPLVIDDAYNANPTSMFSSLDFLTHSPFFAQIKGKFYFVLGEMLELGEKSMHFHETLVRRCLALSTEHPKVFFVFYGKSFSLALEAVFGEKDLKKQRNFLFFSDQPSLVLFLQKSLGLRDAVYFKASNAVNLQSVIDKITAVI